MSKIKLNEFTGETVVFDYNNPVWSLLTPTIIAGSLANQARYNGHATDEHDVPYSVAQHVVLACALAVRSNDRQSIARYMLHHDDTEAVTGDIVSPLKSLIPELAAFTVKMERSYANYIELPSMAVSQRVKELDYAMYLHEASELFETPNFTEEDQALYNAQRHLFEPIRAWSPANAYSAYIQCVKAESMGQQILSESVHKIISYANERQTVEDGAGFLQFDPFGDD